MIAAAKPPRWALSFADLCLLLLGFFVILHARGRDADAVTASVRAAFGGTAPSRAHAYSAAKLFEPGEAVFRHGAAGRFEAIGRAARAGGGRVTIETAGIGGGGNRLDAWELAAARAAAVARAVRTGGLDERRIALAMEPAQDAGGQRIAVTTR